MSDVRIPSGVAVACFDSQDKDRTRSLADRLGLPFLGVIDTRDPALPPLLLGYMENRLSLVPTGKGAPGPVQVDFVTGAMAHRRLHGGGAGQPVARAVGLRPGIRPQVLDATAGLGRDAFVLASLGCEVTLLERSPIVHALLEDALQRGAQDAEVAPIVARMTLLNADAREWLGQVKDIVADVVYLDPMFPHRDKSSLVKKEMRVFRALVGDDDDAGSLLAQALERARYRVVVKRPRLAPELDGRSPSFRLEGKSGRFDIYTLRSMEALKAQ